MSESWPSVTVIMAVLNEAGFIDRVLDQLLGQDYAGRLEIIVADGGSIDGTRERLIDRAEGADQMTVIDNPEVRQAFGLNRAAGRAAGEILVRADGHTSFAPDYVRRSVAALMETAGAVGGPMTPEGENPFGRAVAAAMNSPLTMGPGRFHHASSRERVDTVYLGAFPRSDFLELGGFRSFPSGSSEDADFYYRWRKSGRPVYVDPGIESTYTPRGAPGALWRQYWRYGQGKAEMWWVNGRPPSWRPLAPLALVLTLIAGFILGAVGAMWWPLGLLVVAWVVVLVLVGLRSPAATISVVGAAAIMHLAYGGGMLGGLLFGYSSTRDLRSESGRTSVPSREL